MQCNSINHQAINISQYSATASLNLAEQSASEPTIELSAAKPTHFQTQFQGHMEMYSDVSTVADYLNAHEGWFCRCAQPMTVEPLGENGYILVIGRFGSVGYEVEPKFAVVLQPPENGVYLMQNIPIPGYSSPGYEIDYFASLELLEMPAELAGKGMKAAYRQQGCSKLPPVVTKVQWQMSLDVAVEFPKFICRLPLPLIQRTGDRVLSQIVRQVSPRLTYKVQQDFHSRLNLPIPPKTSRHLQRVAIEQQKAD